jgi:hypothetical protein
MAALGAVVGRRPDPWDQPQQDPVAASLRSWSAAPPPEVLTEIQAT